MKKFRKNHLGAALSVLLLFFTICFVIGVICREQRKLSDRKPQQSQEASWESSNAETGVTETDTSETDASETDASETESQNPSVSEFLDLETESLEFQSPLEEEPLPYKPPCLAIVSDLHYQSRTITDFGKAYRDFLASSDGKLVDYLPEILDACAEEIAGMGADALILTGDITMNGERENHLELAEKLAEIQKAGVPVLVIPGNHDINNPHASYYFGDARTQGQPVTPEEFYEIYHSFGYDQARSRDKASLSYVYELDERYWLMMLDTCQYEPVNLVGGRLKEETLLWMDRELEAAEKAGVTVIPAGHHNLLPQSSLYTTDCAMDNYEDVTALLEKWKLPVYVSGHLHVQRLKKHDGRQLSEERLGPGPRLAAKRKAEQEEEPYGIYEIVSDSVSIAPCQYGVMRWDEEGNMTYQTRLTDVSGWAEKHHSSDEKLADFEAYSHQYVKELIARQIEKKMDPVSWELVDDMTELYADLYETYYAGKVIDEKAVKDSIAWQWWIRLLPDSRQVREMRAMIGDSKKDNNYLYLPKK